MNYVTPFILFVLGLLLWRQQLSSKRRFEVAEQVLAAFHKASDGLSTLRSPMIWAGEIEAAKPKGGDEPAGDDPPMTKSEEQQRRQRRAEIHNVYVARGETISPAFAELRTAQILAEIHFGRPAADAMGVLFRSRHQVLAAVSGLYSGTFDDRYFPTAELEEHHRQFEVSMRALIAEHRAEDGTPDEADALSQRVDAARAKLEGICRPALADPWWMTKLSPVGAWVRGQEPGR